MFVSIFNIILRYKTSVILERLVPPFKKKKTRKVTY